ncbi:hypothetical protein GCM10027169_17910 [Gordonia jinhuaensis]
MVTVTDWDTDVGALPLSPSLLEHPAAVSVSAAAPSAIHIRIPRTRIVSDAPL